MAKKRGPKYEVHAGADGQFYWRLRAANGEIVASSEGYTTEASARRAATELARIAQATEAPDPKEDD